MKILVIQDRLRSGGTERQSILLTRAFLAAGHDAKLLTFRPGGALGPAAADLPRIVLQPFDTHLDWFAPGLFRKVEKFAPDIILCMGRMANCNAGSLVDMMRVKFPRSAIVCTMRTGKRLPMLYVHSLHGVRHVIANSHVSEKILVENYAVPPKKITVIHNSLVFAPENFSSDVGGAPSPRSSTNNRAQLRARFNATEKTIVLLCVAMFRPEKNQRELIDLATQLPHDADWQLWLAGEGSALAACEALVAAKNLGDRVKFTGFQGDPRPLYHAADIAVLTSKSESLSNFLVEAHAHGLPSVAYQVSGVAECGGTVVPPGDQPAFLDALRPLIADAALRARTSAEVRAFAATHFAPERQAAAHLDLFARLLTPDPAPQPVQ
jgi:glycosyltransferase involved in cell wall biosynthesis